MSRKPADGEASPDMVLVRIADPLARKVYAWKLRYGRGLSDAYHFWKEAEPAPPFEEEDR